MSKERSHLDLLRVAGRQHGALSRAQALASGMSPSSVDRRIASGQLKLILPGIYTVLGVPSSWHQRVMAACLWAGAGAVASHQTAGALWALEGIQPGSVEITTPRRLRSQQVSVHQSRLGPGETTVVGRIPVTDVARTLLDLAAAMPEDHVEIAFDDALRRGLVSLGRVRRRLEDLGSRGARDREYCAGCLSLATPKVSRKVCSKRGSSICCDELGFPSRSDSL